MFKCYLLLDISVQLRGFAITRNWFVRDPGEIELCHLGKGIYSRKEMKATRAMGYRENLTM